MLRKQLRSMARCLFACGTLLAAVATSTYLSGLCTDEGILRISPKSGVLGTDGIVVVTAYGAARPFLEHLGKRQPRIVGGGEEIPMVVTELHPGGYNQGQAVLQSVRPLPPDIECRFTLDLTYSDRVEYSLDSWNRELDRRPTWRTRPSVPARWVSTPTLRSKHWQQLGCGPVSFLEYDSPLARSETDPPLLVTICPRFPLAHLRSLEAGSDLGLPPLALQLLQTRAVSNPESPAHEVPDRTICQTAVLHPRDGKIEVGHHMCAGEFTLMPGILYTVEFAALGRDGQRVPAPGGPIEAAGPTPLEQSLELREP